MYWLRDAVRDKEFLLYLKKNLLRLPCDALDRLSPGVTEQGEVLLILVLSTWTGNAVRRRITGEL
jgi:hypothetical protein